MDEDQEDRLVLALAALAAATFVNFGKATPPSEVIAQATEYSEFLAAALN